MCGDGVSNISAGVGGMVNGTGITSRSIARSGACGGGSSVGAESYVNNDLAEVGGFWKVTEEDLVRRSWVEGSEERIWKPSLKICLRW